MQFFPSQRISHSTFWFVIFKASYAFVTSCIVFLLYTLINCMYAKEYTRLYHEDLTYNQMHLTVRCWCGGAVTLKKLGHGLQCQERKIEQT